jgi:methylmalonyl-CoA mutase
MAYTPRHKIRLVTAASLFDGHDAAINIMRRILQASGAEVIHLGHNRSALDIAEAAISEDVQAVAVTSYQGGHREFFPYLARLLRERGCPHVKIFGGGGGTILPREIAQLERQGVTRIYSPDDGRKMGLQGMIDEVMQLSDFEVPTVALQALTPPGPKAPRVVASAITVIENDLEDKDALVSLLARAPGTAPVLGVTGTGGAGKSTVTDEVVRRFLARYPRMTVGVISVDPTMRKSGGALLGDRIRMNVLPDDRVFMRSMATRGGSGALGRHMSEAVGVLKAAGFDLVILESSGIGQEDTTIVDYADVTLYVMTPEYGAATQLEKIGMIDYADVIALNKFDKQGADDALREVRKQYQRSRGLWSDRPDTFPVVGTTASEFHNAGVNALFDLLVDKLREKTPGPFRESAAAPWPQARTAAVIPPSRERYLAEITERITGHKSWISEQSLLATRWYQAQGALDMLGPAPGDSGEGVRRLEALCRELEEKLDLACRAALKDWEALREKYHSEAFTYQVRQREISLPLSAESLSRTPIPRVAFPRYRDWGERLRWLMEENVPGAFPYTAGVFPLKREGEDPTRMFAGEGSPERTNRRFHYVSRDQRAKRLSTAFDSVTLYGEDPDRRPDIYGKIGNAGVSVATLDDAKKLYSGFDLADPATSVSMTINGPAPVMLAFFLCAAVDQQCEKYITENGLWDGVNKKKRALVGDNAPAYGDGAGETSVAHDGLGLGLLGLTGDRVLDEDVYADIRARTLSAVRGTVQADILKEDQAQNTCIFSTEFALRMMGDVQQYFIDHDIGNFYSVSISGYHIAEAGANPITQLAFTLANGFTYVEYYLSRGMKIDEFAPNLSFFFSNGMDPEYAVIGRVARRIWSRAMKLCYGANERSQKLKYHIQTSGRSLHAQEIDFNDIRTTLQALYAVYDNCNSLHTNAFDEAITTPTEHSVRRAMAIQLIINRELGTAKNENPLQGSFLIDELTELVEEAVLAEFTRISEKGGVLGAMERMYQRGRIQEESLYYEMKKNTGELPIVGVNTFLDKDGSPTIVPEEVIRSTAEEKESQIRNLEAIKKLHAADSPRMLDRLKHVAVEGGNIFSELMETVRYCSLGEITHALFDVGGQYRRNM